MVQLREQAILYTFLREAPTVKARLSVSGDVHFYHFRTLIGEMKVDHPIEIEIAIHVSQFGSREIEVPFTPISGCVHQHYYRLLHDEILVVGLRSHPASNEDEALVEFFRGVVCKRADRVRNQIVLKDAGIEGRFC